MLKRKISWVELITMVTLTVGLFVLVTVVEIPFPFESSKRRDHGIPFKCINCGEIEKLSIRELQERINTEKNKPLGPMMGPMTLICPNCGKKTMTQAVVCPSCEEIFVLKMDSANRVFDDKCPRCGKSYVKAWQEKYRKSGG